MAGNNLSLKAGTVCATCNNPDPCLHTITIDQFDKKKHIWPEEQKIYLSLLDDGKGCDGTIQLESKCGKPDCPVATLENDDEKIPLQAGAATPVKLYFKKPGDAFSRPVKVSSLWDYLDNIALPTDMFSEPNEYNLITQGCYQCSNYAKIDVYPTVEFQVGIGFSYEQKGRERTWKERTSERIAAQKNMKNAKPKNKNKLRSGWTLHTDQFEIAKEYKVSAEYQLNVGGFERSKDFSYATKKIERYKTIQQINKIKKFISNLADNLLEDKDSKVKSRKMIPLNINFAPVQMGVAYAYQRLDDIVNSSHYIGFVAAPLLKTDLKLNILPLLAMLSRNAKVVEFCNKLIASKALDVYIMVSLDLHISIAATLQNQSWEFFEPDGKAFTGTLDTGEGTKLQGGLTGEISAAYDKEALWANVSFKFHIGGSTKIQTSLGVALDNHSDGLDLVCYHDGIVIDLKFETEFKAEDRRGEYFNTKKSKQYEEKIVLGKPHEIENSPVRVNLFGKSRLIA
ncbi:hypothetical protein [Siccibacter turicensis]|uniref:hypothetical protein n=1 Tax=Siccibacter turicensis TaxID=357233 RepID=UPI0004632C9B|nr:hypothetical protein [Siccibacter turicensis]